MRRCERTSLRGYGISLIVTALAGCGGQFDAGDNSQTRENLETGTEGNGPISNQLYHQGVIGLDFNPAFLKVDDYVEGKALTIGSFFNAWPNPLYDRNDPSTGFPVLLVERDLVARIGNLGSKAPGDITANDVEVLTDQFLPLGQGKPGDGNTLFAANTIWPNDVEKVEDDVFTFEAVVVPQGFHSALKAGRLSLIDLTNQTPQGHYPEYVVHQSGTDSQSNPDRFYHRAVFVDMNLDGRKDLVTVRSGFRVGTSSAPPSGELVWFAQPENYDGSQAWTEYSIYQMPFPGSGPDLILDMADLNADGIEEIVATHFFTGDPGVGGSTPVHGKIVIYGVPEGFSSWVGVGYGSGQVPPLRKVVSQDQGYPFHVEFVDLNRDGWMDILATNHQPSADFSPVPGRTYALEQPASGDLFTDDWAVHVLLNHILPNPNVPPFRPPGRMAPGGAAAFATHVHSKNNKPWIVVSGDEASKVWILKPKNQSPYSWEYDASIIFDINQAYGEDTTQTPTEQGITISTLGRIAVGYDDKGWAEIYIPVFEAKDIHLFSFKRP